MAAYTVTAANVLMSASGKYKDLIAGATITAGQAVYIDTADSNKVKLTDANGANLLHTCDGIALNGASAGQPVRICTHDPQFTPGCTLAIGDVIIAGATAGEINPVSDLASGWYALVLGVAYSTSQCVLNCASTPLQATAAKA